MIVANRIQCNNCKDVIQSFHRHDFKMCSCESVAVDGGVSYLRRVGTNYTEMSLQHTDNFEEIRKHMYWGKNYDKDGNLLEETEWILLKDITDDHLEGLIKYWEERILKYEGADVFLNIFKKEKKWREN